MRHPRIAAPRRRPLAVILALLLVATLGTAAGRPEPEPAAPSAPAAATTPAAPAEYRATLITGDHVVVTFAPDGSYSVAFDPAAGSGSTHHQQYRHGEDVYVIPSAAAHLVGDLLDPELFNVTALAEAGYAEATPVIVQHRPGARTLAAATGLTTTATLPSVDAVAGTVAPDGRWFASLTRGTPGPLAAGDAPAGVERVWLDAPVEVQLAESVPQIGAPQAWQAGFDGTGLTVAVLDTGIDADHPDLAGTVVAAENFTDTDSATDGHGHGTHVASTVAGRGVASDGARRGVAPGAMLLNGKVIGDDGNGQTSWVLAGMEWAAPDADVVNMSLGAGFTDGTDLISQSLNDLTDAHGTLFVVSAGNSGGDRTITTPGTADAALTVGAVDKSDQLAGFSSRGPRRGDWAIKPDVTAPGVGIIAARAAGTSLGTPVDAHHTALQGTSMAAPHVAGAAAVLLQRDPDLTPQELTSALVTTAVPNDSLSVYQQGGGRIDLAAALESPVLAEPAPLDIGHFPFPHDDDEPVATEVSFTNRGDEALTLDLSLRAGAVRGPPVPGDQLTVTPSTLDLAPGETGTATVDLDLPALAVGLYSGSLLATHDGAPVSRIPVGFHKEDEMYDVSIQGFDRSGAPASGSMAIMDVEDMSRVFMPSFPFINGEALARVPPGTYSIMGGIMEFDQPGQFTQAISLVGDPEVSVTGPTTLELHAADASRVEVETPSHDARPQGAVSFGYWRTADTPGPLFSTTWGGRNTQPTAYYAMATEPVTRGGFEYHSRWTLAAPEAELGIVEPVTEPLDPYLLLAPAVDGEQVVPLVDAGAGEAADFAGLDATGRAVLVRRHPDPIFYQEQERLAAEAGAVALIVANTVPGTMTGHFAATGTIPVLAVPQAEGERLAGLLADGDVTVRLDGTVWSDFRYDLMLVEQGVIPDELRYVLTPEDLTTLEMSFHNDHDGHLMNVGRDWLRPFHGGFQALHPPIEGPRTRTEYVVGGDTIGYRSTFYGEQPFDARLRGQDFTFYEPGRTYDLSGFRQVMRPALLPGVDQTARSGDTMELRVFEWVDADGNYFPNHVFGLAPYPGDTVTTRVWRDGELVGTVSGSPRANLPMAPGPASYRVALSVDREADWWTRSTSTRTEWTFASQRPDAGPVPLPMLSVDYDLPLDLRNTSPHPRDLRGPATLEVRVRHQDAGLPAVAGARVWVSFDDGDTWQSRPTRPRGDGEFEVRMPRRATPGADAVSVRVEAWDAAGNRVTQQVIRAWNLPS